MTHDNKDIDKKLLYKILWRIKFLFFESWNKDLDAIICSLKSAEKRTYSGLAGLLNKKKIISWENINNFFEYNNFRFYYDDLPLIDFLNIWLYNSSFINRNFINNSAYHFDGPYDIENVMLNSGDYVIDAGANIGLFSIYSSKKIGKKGKVFSFEPIQKTRGILTKNINFNKNDNIKIFGYALGNNNNDIEFNLSNSLGASSFFEINKNINKKEKVRQITLDDFVFKNNINKIDFIKADIEGMERYLLQGAKNTIKYFKPKISICIYHFPDDYFVIENLIKSFVPGYNIVKNDYKLYAWV